jgi:hypothetical protein
LQLSYSDFVWSLVHLSRYAFADENVVNSVIDDNLSQCEESAETKEVEQLDQLMVHLKLRPQQLTEFLARLEQLRKLDSLPSSAVGSTLLVMPDSVEVAEQNEDLDGMSGRLVMPYQLQLAHTLTAEQKTALLKRHMRQQRMKAAVAVPDELLKGLDALFEHSVYASPLKALFEYYGKTVAAARQSSAVSGSSFSKLGSVGLDLAGLSVFSRDMRLVPALLTRAQLSDAFRWSNRKSTSNSMTTTLNHTPNAQQNELNPLSLTFPEFCHCVARMACAAYPRSLYSLTDLAQQSVEERFDKPIDSEISVAEKVQALFAWLKLDEWRAPGKKNQKTESSMHEDMSSASLRQSMNQSTLAASASSLSISSLRKPNRQSLVGSEAIARLRPRAHTRTLLQKDGRDALLKKVFSFYARSQALYGNHASFESIAADSQHINQGEAIACLKDFNVYPALIGRDAVVAIFKAQSAESSVETNREDANDEHSARTLNFVEFKDWLIRLALFISSSMNGTGALIETAQIVSHALSDITDVVDREQASKLMALLAHMKLLGRTNAMDLGIIGEKDTEAVVDAEGQTVDKSRVQTTMGHSNTAIASLRNRMRPFNARSSTSLHANTSPTHASSSPLGHSASDLLQTMLQQQHSPLKQNLMRTSLSNGSLIEQPDVLHSAIASPTRTKSPGFKHTRPNSGVKGFEPAEYHSLKSKENEAVAMDRKLIVCLLLFQLCLDC